MNKPTQPTILKNLYREYDNAFFPSRVIHKKIPLVSLVFLSFCFGGV